MRWQAEESSIPKFSLTRCNIVREWITDFTTGNVCICALSAIRLRQDGRTAPGGRIAGRLRRGGYPAVPVGSVHVVTFFQSGDEPAVHVGEGGRHGAGQVAHQATLAPITAWLLSEDGAAIGSVQLLP